MPERKTAGRKATTSRKKAGTRGGGGRSRTKRETATDARSASRRAAPDGLSPEIRREAAGISWLGLAVLLFVALWAPGKGAALAWLADGLLWLLGRADWLVPLLLAAGGALLLFAGRFWPRERGRLAGFALATLIYAVWLQHGLPLASAFSSAQEGGGLIGATVWSGLALALGRVGGLVVLATAALVALVLILHTRLSNLVVRAVPGAGRGAVGLGHWLRDFFFEEVEDAADDRLADRVAVKLPGAASDAAGDAAAGTDAAPPWAPALLEPESDAAAVRGGARLGRLDPLANPSEEWDSAADDPFSGAAPRAAAGAPEAGMGAATTMAGMAAGAALAGAGGTAALDPADAVDAAAAVDGNGRAAGSKRPHTAPPTEASGGPAQLSLDDYETYRLPPLSLLKAHGGHSDSGRQRRNGMRAAKALEETLASFGIQARVVAIDQGPAVTRYEVQPAAGVKVSRIVSLADDIALALAATAVRVVAPIPGKAAVGIEVPNREVRTVAIRDVLEAPAFQRSASKLSLALGEDVAGQPVVATLERMLHVLIAGATGSGKSVCLNTILASILYKARPDEVKLLLIDPKRVELSMYNGIPHLLAPVIADPKQAAGALRWIQQEMVNRYETFADWHVRDIHRFNEQAQAKGKRRLPFIVVVIDELADLMLVAARDVEDAIQRLAQMARAAGIHLLVATQRPSVDVITGVIKANIPSRISFAVSSQADSRTILDGGGAEKLLGKGDMLFYPMGAPKPVRSQGAFISERELEAVLAFVRDQAEPEFEDAVVQAGNASALAADDREDDLFVDAVRIVVETGQASVSMLQRRLRVGFTRAGRLVDMMERHGFVGPHQGSKARDVLITAEEFEQRFGLGNGGAAPPVD